MVRKLGVPGQEELAMGAIATGGIVVWNRDVLDYVSPSPHAINAEIERARRELDRRDRAYRGERPHPQIRNQTVIVIVAAPETCDAFRDEVDDVVCAATPQPFRAVGLWYCDFSPTSDAEVRELLQRADAARKAGAA